MQCSIDTYEAIYSVALGLVAQGEPRGSTLDILCSEWPEVEASEIAEAMDEALTDALRSGVEREDIDPSWL